MPVRTAEEFIAAVGSDRTVQLAPGEYDLTAVKQRKMDHVLWREQHDGYDICIRNVKNLRIEGAGATKVRVLVSPRYAYVLAFRNVSGLSLANLELGHGPEKGYCTGGVVELTGCRDVSIADCVLFGCGTEGLTLQDTTGLDFRRSVIRDCSYGILTAAGCKRLTFQDSAFTGNREFHGFALSDCAGVAFRNCRIENNSLISLDYPLFSATSCSKVTVSGGTIRSNVYKRLMQPDDSVEIKDITLENNTPPK